MTGPRPEQVDALARLLGEARWFARERRQCFHDVAAAEWVERLVVELERVTVAAPSPEHGPTETFSSHGGRPDDAGSIPARPSPALTKTMDGVPVEEVAPGTYVERVLSPPPTPSGPPLAALELYGEHLADCAVVTPHTLYEKSPCTCGLNATIASYRASAPPPPAPSPHMECATGGPVENAECRHCADDVRLSPLSPPPEGPSAPALDPTCLWEEVAVALHVTMPVALRIVKALDAAYSEGFQNGAHGTYDGPPMARAIAALGASAPSPEEPST